MTLKFSVVGRDVEELLGLTKRFHVPPFQRRYAWKEHQVTQLLTDVFNADEGSYFLGSIVIVDSPGDPRGILILDGQQRLVTLSLIIAVMKEMMGKMKSSECMGPASELQKFLFAYGRRGVLEYKLDLQQQDNDLFQKLITSPHKEAAKLKGKPRLKLAVESIHNFLSTRLNAVPKKGRCEELISFRDRLIHDVEIVQISAPSEGDAYQLFETLNDRGLSLNAADLIKNKLLAQSGQLAKEAANEWTKLLTVVRDDDVVAFLRTYWIAEFGDVRKRELYSKFSDKISALSSAKSLELTKDLCEAAQQYEPFFAPTQSPQEWGADVSGGLQRLLGYGVKTCRPALLACARKHPEQMRVVVDICESVYVRYLLVGDENPNRLERLYASLAEVIRQNSKPWSAIVKSKMFSLIPGDDEFAARLVTSRVGAADRKWRQFLLEVISSLGEGELRIEEPSKVHLEHILPQSVSDAVLRECKLSEEEYEQWIYRIGNLTFLSGKKNIKLSNRPFSKKRLAYCDSDIKVTRELSRHKRWTSKEILSRGKELAEGAIARYPHPDDILSGLKT